jgi:outer membrane protein
LNKTFAVFSVLALAFAGLAGAQAPAAAQAPAGPPPTKIGIIAAANVIHETLQGQKADEELGKEFQPKKDALDKKQAQIQAWTDQLSKGRATLSAEAQAKLKNDIDALTKTAQRDQEDAQAELDDRENRIMQDLGGKMMAILSEYASTHGFAVILDVSSQQTPVLWAAQTASVDAEIKALFDAKYPVAAASAAPAAAPAKPAAPAKAPATAPAKPPAK